MTETELQQVPGFGTRYKLDGFLTAHGALIDDYTADSLAARSRPLTGWDFKRVKLVAATGPEASCTAPT